MATMDAILRLERDAEGPTTPQWYPSLGLADPCVPECLLARGVVIWRVATSAPPSYARMFTLMGHHFIVSDDSRDLHQYLLEHWRREDA